MIRLLLLVVLTTVTLAACGTTNTGGTGAGSGTTADGVDRARLSAELYFFNWSDYIEPSILEDFEAEYGVRVIMDLYDANEAMIAKIRAGNSGYDVVVPSDYAVQSMVAEGLLAPLDTTLLTNSGNNDPALMGLFFDEQNAYSMPYFWSTTGIAYNTTVFPTPPTSWSALFDPAQLAAISGKFTMLDDARETPGAALIYQGQSVNTTDPAALAAARELLIAQKPFVAAYDSANTNLKLATEEIVIAHYWSGGAGQAIVGLEDKPGNPNIDFTIPQEGGVIWMDTLAIVHDSPNQYTANVFINYLMRPEVAAKNADYVLYLTPNQAARALLSAETQAVLEVIEPSAEERERLQWIERTGESDTAFSQLWTEVLAE
ncbi:spermidine/putrescine ABC transporter substrate-binding protein [Candidatus Gracilibacteria bacterium]|nr:spermidine/putrescine ABC transporter substrate-binding protein [Candidatus Gracilibacteria bacterium]